MEIMDIPLGSSRRETYCVVDAVGSAISLAIEEHRPAWAAQGWREYAQVQLSLDAARRLREVLGEIIERVETMVPVGQSEMFGGRG